MNLIKRNKLRRNHLLVKPVVSGSFSMFEVKDLLWYGETRDLKVILKENPRKIGDLNIALDMMFDLLEKHTYFDRKKVEDVFWNRVRELANTSNEHRYTHLKKLNYGNNG